MANLDAEHPEIEPQNPPRDGEEQFPHAGRLLLLIVLIFVLVVASGVVLNLHQRQSTRRLAEANQQLEAELKQTRGQIAVLSAQLKTLTTPVDPQPISPPDESWTQAGAQGDPASAASSQHAGSETPAWETQLRRQLREQRQKLETTRQTLAKTRSALESKLASTRGNLSELSDTVARNHAQVAALNRLGQRDYYEFDLAKSKHLQREGPISLSLRHTDTKHQNYDMDLLIDDVKLSRKHVNLYEPVMFQISGSRQPLELVVNQIGKDHVHGYVSAPKEIPARTADAAAPGPAASADAPAFPPRPDSTTISEAKSQ
ncbi:MAG TPA: hypothetical protein VFZ08_14580 [Terriglobia bacterium]|nr:hypothetical protein [Terriglobia bacterium]